MVNKYTIKHLDRILHTSHYTNISDTQCNEIRMTYNEKPCKNLVNKQLIKINEGKYAINLIVNYYFKDLMCKVKLRTAKWSIEEMLQSNDLIRYYYSRILSNSKVYPTKRGIQSNFSTAIRIGGGSVAMKPSNFPIKTVDYIINKYNINDKYYDFSCGWCVRHLSSFRNNIS